MRIILIVLGVLALVWLSFLSFDRNQIRNDMDGMNQRFEDYDNRFNEMPIQDDKGIIDKTEDSVDRTEDEFDKNVKMPYEEGKPHLKGTDEVEPQAPVNEKAPAKQEKVVPKKTNDVPKKNNEANANQGDSIVAFLNIPQHKLEGESIVAYADKSESAYDEQRLEAYQVLHFIENKFDNSQVAYKSL